MNILLLNHYAGSPEMGMEFRPYYFAREWVKMGHSVKIVAGDFSHLRTKQPEVKRDFQKEIIDGIEYRWVKTGNYKGNGIQRALSMFRFVGKLFIHSSKIAKVWKPDIVIASSTYPLDTYPAQRIAKKAKAKLIHEVHDMWPITPIEIGGMSKYHPFVMILQLAENSFCKHSDYVVSLLPNAKAYLKRHGMAENNFVFISNGVVLSEWENKEELPDKTRLLIEQIKTKYKFVLCFFGSHTKSYALEYIIEAIRYFDNTKVGLVLVGDGTDKQNLIKQSENIKNIYFFDPIPKKCIPTFLENVDGIYIGALNNKMFRFGIAMNKLFDSMMSGKPILYAVNAPNNYIKKYKCGISVEAESVEALRKGIEVLINKTEEERMKLGNNGREAVLKYYNYKVLAKEFEKIF